MIDLLDGSSLPASFGDLISPDEALNSDFSPDSQEDSSTPDPLLPLLPPWLVSGAKVTIALDGVLVRGTLDLDDDFDWLFVRRNSAGQIVHEHCLVDLPFTWRQRLHEEPLFTGWNCLPPPGPPDIILGNGHHVSASTLHHPCPPTLLRALLPTFPDSPVWLDSYCEEYDSLLAQDTFSIITKHQLSLLPCMVLPCMTVLTIKCDELGHPVRANPVLLSSGTLRTPIGQNPTRTLQS